MRISSLNCVVLSAALCAHLVSCGGAFSSLESPDPDAGDGAGGAHTEAGPADAGGRSGGNNSGGAGGAGGRGGTDGGSSAGRGGSAGGGGASGKGGASGSTGTGGASGTSGRGGSAGAIDAGGASGASGRGGTGGITDGGGAAGSAGQADASRRDADAVSDAFGRDAVDGSAGSGGKGGSGGAAGSGGVAGTSGAAGSGGAGGSAGTAGSGGLAGSNGVDVHTDILDVSVDVGWPDCSTYPPSDCAFCCTTSHPQGVRQYQQIMYGCACGDCLPQCAMTLCETNMPDPSVACLNCIRGRPDTTNCAPGFESCGLDAACAGYMKCAHACFP